MKPAGYFKKYAVFIKYFQCLWKVYCQNIVEANSAETDTNWTFSCDKKNTSVTGMPA